MASETLQHLVKTAPPLETVDVERIKPDLLKLKQAIDDFERTAGKKADTIWMKRETKRDQFGNAEELFGIPIEVDATLPPGNVYFGIKQGGGLRPS